MWRIKYKGLTLQQVLIMAYMNVLEPIAVGGGLLSL